MMVSHTSIMYQWVNNSASPPAAASYPPSRRLADRLLRKGVASKMQVIAKARVPIIKFEACPSGINFDVSFDVANGPQAAGLVSQLVSQWPPMKALVLLLKVFLQQRELNEVYSGGIGSYALLTMVASYLQLHASRSPEPGPPSE